MIKSPSIAKAQKLNKYLIPKYGDPTNGTVIKPNIPKNIPSLNPSKNVAFCKQKYKNLYDGIINDINIEITTQNIIL